MSSVYIISDNGKLSKKDETLVFSQVDGTSTILFPYKTELLVLMGNVSVSGNALRLLTKYKIPVIILSKNGRFNGKLTFGENKNVFLRQKQYEILSDLNRSLEIARSIVLGKIKNQISFMQRIKRKSELSKEDEEKIENAITQVKFSQIKAVQTDDIEKLRGFEGMAARNYFSVFGMNINPSWAVFNSRSKNPPRTNVNAVLSFLYTLLMYRVESVLESQGLDSCCGNLHALNYGKTALVFDLMEEFRVPIADSVCCSLFNLGILKENDFEKVEFTSESDEFPLENTPDSSDERIEESDGKGILLTKDGLKKVICAFEEKMDSSILYVPQNTKLSYKKILYKQAEHYKRVIMGEETEYKSYYFK